MLNNEFVEQLKQLVACQTLPGNLEENARALDMVTDWLSKKAKVKRIKNGRAEIFIAANNETLNPDVAYMVHIDVVAGTDEQFSMKTDGDKLVGRGTSDMKFSIPIGAALLNEVIEENNKINFALVITTDEEVGGFEGARYLVEQLKFAPKLLIVPDGGDELTFVDKAKGICQLVVESKGKPAHASRLWMGENALESLVELGHELISKFGQSNRTESWNTTMNLGVLTGGISVNQVCADGVLKLDFRFPETESVESIKKMVEEMAAGINRNMKVSLLAFGQPTFTDVNLPIVKSFLKIMNEAVGKEIEVKSTHGASDARWFAGQKVPVLMIKPMGGEIHSNDEWISLESCMKFYEGLRKFIGSLQ